MPLPTQPNPTQPPHPELFRTLTTAVIPHIRSDPALAGRVQFIIRQQIQPWHPSSTLVHEAALAVQQLLVAAWGDNGGGKVSERFWAFSGALFAEQASFFDEAVAGEPRNATYARLAALAARSGAGVAEADVYRLLAIGESGGEPKNAGNAVTADVKVIVKMARLVGVHVTPTVVFNGVVAGEISSGWTEEQWKEWLKKNIV